MQDRSFDALAAATGFLASQERRRELDLAAVAAERRPATAPVDSWAGVPNKTYSSKKEFLKDRAAATNYDPRCVL